MRLKDISPFYPSFWQACTLLFRLMILLLAWGFALGPVFEKSGIQQGSTLAYVLQWVFPNIVFSSVIIWYGLKRAGLSLKSLGFSKTVPSSVYPYLFLLVLGQILLIFELSPLIQRLDPFSDFWIYVLYELFLGNIVLVFLTVAIIAPVVEEIIFRGIILRGFLRRYSVVKALILSSLLFGFIHLNITQFITAFLVGLLLGWIYYKTNSLLFVILAHALHNASFVIFYWLFGLEQSDISSGIFLVAGSAFIAWGIYMLSRLMHQNDSLQD